MRQVKRERMCEYPGRSHRRIKVDVFEKKKCVVTTNCEKSAEVIVSEINFVKDRTIQRVKLKCMSR